MNITRLELYLRLLTNALVSLCVNAGNVAGKRAYWNAEYSQDAAAEVSANSLT